MKPKEIILHQHDLADFMVCPKRYQLANVLGYEPIQLSKALDIGDLFAKCIYRLHKGTPIAECLVWVNKEHAEAVKMATSQEWIDELAEREITVQAMLNGYKEHYLDSKEIQVANFNSEGGISGFENIVIEKTIPEHPVSLSFSVGGVRVLYVNRLDAKIIDVLGRTFILELKTTANYDNNLFWKLNTNFQILSYWFSLERAEKINVTGVLYRYIKKPSLRKGKKESSEDFQKRIMLDYLQRPDNYFKEECLFFNRHSQEQFKKDFIYHFYELVRCYENDTWPCRGTACDGKYGLCKYIKYCSNPNEDTLNTLFRRRKV